MSTPTISNGWAAVLAAFVAVMAATPASADVTIVSDDFESYADSAALYAVWGPSNSAGELIDETFTEFITIEDIEPQAIGTRAFPEGGQGVEHTGGSVLEYQISLNGGAPLLPTATQSIVLQGDIFDTGALGNKRMSIGLRSNAPENLVELGQWNSDPANGLAYRGVLFPTPPEEPNVNWLAYDLPLEFDRPEDGDEITTIADLGETWHTYRATITPETITYEIDLFRDGTFDASATHPLVTGVNGYDSLRIGSPSGVPSGGNGIYGGVIFDNISLTLVDVVTGGNFPGDANGDGTVDLLDLDILGSNFGITGTGTFATGDFNGDTNVDLLDLDILGGNFGNSAGTSAAIPEPAAGLLAAMGLLAAVRRRV